MYVSMHTYVRTCVCMHACIHTYVSVDAWMHTYILMYISMHVCMYVCTVCMHTYVRTLVCTYIHINNHNKQKFVLRLKMQKQLLVCHCTSAGRMTSILRHVAEAFSPARQGTILNNHRVICTATNTSMVLTAP